jgi:hypothetical protein
MKQFDLVTNVSLAGLVLFSVFAYIFHGYFAPTGSQYGAGSMIDFLIGFTLILGGTGIFIKSIWYAENSYKFKKSWVVQFVLGILFFLFSLSFSMEGLGYPSYIIYPIVWVIVFSTLSKATARMHRVASGSFLYYTFFTLTMLWLSVPFLVFFYLSQYDGHF